MSPMEAIGLQIRDTGRSALLEVHATGQFRDMPKPDRPAKPNVPRNNTVKLGEALRDRIAKAMAAEGFTVWSEFCRVALTEKCAASERSRRVMDSSEHVRVSGRDGVGRDGVRAI